MALETPTPEMRASAMGEVANLTLEHNNAGKPWVTFTLHTPSGQLLCVCFPNSFELVDTRLVDGRRVVVHGQSGDDGTEFRVIEVERAPIST